MRKRKAVHTAITHTILTITETAIEVAEGIVMLEDVAEMQDVIAWVDILAKMAILGMVIW